jgi:hypothetical protein
MSGETVRRFTDREIADAYTKFRMAIKGQIVQVEDYVRASDYDRQVKWLTEENARLAHDLDAASIDQKNALARVKELEGALRLAQYAMRAPLDDWKGEVERKALDAARSALAKEGK